MTSRVMLNNKAPASDSLKLVEQIKQFQRNEPQNKRCADCGDFGPTFICMDFGTFICTVCSGLHREFSHRVKSVSLSDWKNEEVQFILERGNAFTAEKYLRGCDFKRDIPPSGSGDIQKLRIWIRHKYLDKRWVKSPRKQSADTKTKDGKPRTTTTMNQESKKDGTIENEQKKSSKSGKKHAITDLLDLEFFEPTPVSNIKDTSDIVSNNILNFSKSFEQQQEQTSNITEKPTSYNDFEREARTKAELAVDMTDFDLLRNIQESFDRNEISNIKNVTMRETTSILPSTDNTVTNENIKENPLHGNINSSLFVNAPLSPYKDLDILAEQLTTFKQTNPIGPCNNEIPRTGQMFFPGQEAVMPVSVNSGIPDPQKAVFAFESTQHILPHQSSTTSSLISDVVVPPNTLNVEPTTSPPLLVNSSHSTQCVSSHSTAPSNKASAEAEESSSFSPFANNVFATTTAKPHPESKDIWLKSRKWGGAWADFSSLPTFVVGSDSCSIPTENQNDFC